MLTEYLKKLPASLGDVANLKSRGETGPFNGAYMRFPMTNNPGGPWMRSPLANDPAMGDIDVDESDADIPDADSLHTLQHDWLLLGVQICFLTRQ